jgi:hypothetical protein
MSWFFIVLPALVIDGNVLTGFHDIKDLEARIQESFKLQSTIPQGTAAQNHPQIVSLKAINSWQNIKWRGIVNIIWQKLQTTL